VEDRLDLPRRKSCRVLSLRRMSPQVLRNLVPQSLLFFFCQLCPPDGIGCARAGIPALYARTSGFADWIRETICNVSAEPPHDCPRSRTHNNDTQQLPPSPENNNIATTTAPAARVDSLHPIPNVEDSSGEGSDDEPKNEDLPYYPAAVVSTAVPNIGSNAPTPTLAPSNGDDVITANNVLTTATAATILLFLSVCCCYHCCTQILRWRRQREYEMILTTHQLEKL